MSSPRTVKLTIISDLTCPWCYVGQRQLEEAIKQSSALPLRFEIEYRPYRVNQAITDDMPAMHRANYLQHKFGKEKYEALTAMISARGEKLGIHFAWGGKFSQTTRAHRLLLKAWQVGGQDMQQRLVKLLFRAAFEEELDVGEVEVLADRAEQAGLMSKEQAVDFYDTDENLEEVIQMMQESRTNGVSGVPFTVLDNKWALSGGQTSDVYVQIFQKMASCYRAQEEAAGKPSAMPCQAPVVAMTA